MKKRELENRVLNAASTIGKMVSEVYDSDPWKNLERRQALRDALEALKRHHLINSYNVVTGEINENRD